MNKLIAVPVIALGFGLAACGPATVSAPAPTATPTASASFDPSAVAPAVNPDDVSPVPSDPTPSSPTDTTPAPATGAIDPAVTQANIGSTICVPGYTATVRPPESYTYALKKAQLAARGIYSVRGYVENHIIPLELGGAPSDPANLAPELAGPSHAQDQVENKLHREVCAGQISLAAAQAEVVRTS